MKKLVPFLLLLAMAAGCAALKVKSKNVKYMEIEIAKTCTLVKDGYFQNAKTQFSISRDTDVYVFIRFKYLENKTQKVRIEWFSPSGLYYTSEPISIGDANAYFENASVFQSLDIRNMADYGLLGKWRALVKLNDKVIHTLEFELLQ